MFLTRLFSFVLALFCLGPVVYSQGVLEIETNLTDGAVYVDSVYAGTTITRYRTLPGGTHRIVLVPVSLDSWQVGPEVREVTIIAGDTTRLVVEFDRAIRVETLPFGADVFWVSERATEFLGKSPLTVEKPVAEMGSFLVEKDGYLPRTLEPDSAVFQALSTILEADANAEERRTSVVLENPRRQNRWIEWTTAVIGAAGGVYSIVNKFKADDIYEVYEETGDPRLRPEFRRYDVRSAVGLGVMQAGVGILAVRLFLR